MKAEDTVMKPKQVFKIVREHAPADYCQLSLDIGELVAEAQAEISFPLGEKAGIKEVVKDFETVLDAPPRHRLEMFFDILNTWQAKLKEEQ